MVDRIMAMLSTKRVPVGEEGGYYIKESESKLNYIYII